MCIKKRITVYLVILPSQDLKKNAFTPNDVCTRMLLYKGINNYIFFRGRKKESYLDLFGFHENYSDGSFISVCFLYKILMISVDLIRFDPICNVSLVFRFIPYSF